MKACGSCQKLALFQMPKNIGVAAFHKPDPMMCAHFSAQGKTQSPLSHVTVTKYGAAVTLLLIITIVLITATWTSIQILIIIIHRLVQAVFFLQVFEVTSSLGFSLNFILLLFACSFHFRFRFGLRVCLGLRFSFFDRLT